MRSIYRYIATLAVALSAAFTGCINDNDIPYPVVTLSITSVAGDGFAQKSISSSNRTVTLSLEEQTDIRAVNITDVVYTSGATLSNPVVGVFDMRLPIYTTLSLYQNYPWTIEAEQSIERYFTVEGQIGAEVIDADNLTVSVEVDKNSYDPTNVVVRSMKLGPADITTYSPTAAKLTNFESSCKVDVTAHDRTEQWRVTITPVEAMTTLTVSAWGELAWLKGTGVTDDPAACQFRYRLSDSTDEWITVVADSADGGIFTSCITGLQPETKYDFQAVVDTTESEVSYDVLTEATPQLPNTSFNTWSTEGSKDYYVPYLSSDDKFWDSGNKGSTLGSTNIYIPDNSVIAPTADAGSYSAQLKSAFVNVFGIGQFAAGNIFTGEFLGTEGLDGIIRFGRSFSSRPLALKGYAYYNQGTVNYSNASTNSDIEGILESGDPDQGIVYIMLGTWTPEEYGTECYGYSGNSDSPVIVCTKTADRDTIKRLSERKDVVAYGEVVYNASTNGWVEFNIELEYYDNFTQPTNIIVVSTSSRYGDYFTGSTNSTLWLDELELIYDPADL